MAVEHPPRIDWFPVNLAFTVPTSVSSALNFI